MCFKIQSLVCSHLKTTQTLQDPTAGKWDSHWWQTRDMIIFHRQKRNFLISHTSPCEPRSDAHSHWAAASSGGRSRSRLNYMRSPAVNHTSPRQPAVTPSRRQHQWGPIPSTGDRRAEKTTVSFYPPSCHHISEIEADWFLLDSDAFAGKCWSSSAENLAIWHIFPYMIMLCIAINS